MKIGYVRVSDRDQNPGRQIEKFKELGIENRFIFIDKYSGSLFNRPKYQAMRQVIREGDIVYFDALDRLGRDYDGILREWKDITRNMKADIICLDNPELFNSKRFKEMGDIGKAIEDTILAMLAYVADQGKKKIKQTQREGIDLALSKGVKFGRPKKPITPLFISAFNQWQQHEITAVKAMKIANMKPGTFYRRVKEYKERLAKGGARVSCDQVDNLNFISLAPDEFKKLAAGDLTYDQILDNLNNGK
jgi:DNA invertase Pin-like site-specific DNA recombinase